MVYRGRVVNGAVVLDGSVKLPEGATVQVVVLEAPGDAAREPAARTVEEQIAAIVSKVPPQEWKRLPEDLSDRVDRYVYGVEEQ